MTKYADNPSYSVDRLIWRSIEIFQAHLPPPVSSRVVTTLGFLAAAIVSAEICSHPSAPDGSGNFPPDEVLANTEILLAPAAAASVSEVPKMPRALPRAASQAPALGPNIAMTDANSETSLLSGENVLSMMLMTGVSVAPTAAADVPVSAVMPSAVTPKPRLKPKPTAQKPEAVKQPQTKLSWWRRLPWLPLPR